MAIDLSDRLNKTWLHPNGEPVKRDLKPKKDKNEEKDEETNRLDSANGGSQSIETTERSKETPEIIENANPNHDPKSGKFSTGKGSTGFCTEEEAIEATKNSKYIGELLHGTSSMSANNLKDDGFDDSKIGSASGRAVLGDGMYLTDSKEVSDYFAKQSAFAEYSKEQGIKSTYTKFNKEYKKNKLGSVIKSRVNIKNPKIFNNPQDYDKAVIKYAIKKGYVNDEAEYKSKYYDGYSLAQIAREYGNSVPKSYDSIIIKKDDMGIMTEYGSRIADNTTVLVRDFKNIYPYKIEVTK